MSLRQKTMLLAVLPLPLMAACANNEPEHATLHPVHIDAGGTEAGRATGATERSPVGNQTAPDSGSPTSPVTSADSGQASTQSVASDSGQPAKSDTDDGGAGQQSSPVVADDAGQMGTAQSVLVTLNHLDSCNELNTVLRERARDSMNADLDALKTQVSADAGAPSWCYMWEGTATVTGMGGALAPAANGSSSAPSSVSETNNQVAGVDEADLVKTDGKFLYLAQGRELRIVSAWPAEQTQLASTLFVGGTAKKLLLDKDRVVLFVSLPRGTTGASKWAGQNAKDCTYGYDCDFSGDGSATDVVIVDVSDRASPKILRRLSFSGSLIAARGIGNAVHAVVSIGSLNVPNLVTPNLQQYCSLGSSSKDGGTSETEQRAAALAAIEQARATNNKLIDAAEFDFGTLAREGERPIAATDCTDFYRELSGDGSALTTLVSLDMQADRTPTLANIVSRAGAVYASEASLYMSVSHRRAQMRGWYPGQLSDEASTVHAFRISKNPSDTAYLGSGVVPGRVLNQFSMDEFDGHLRIATTKGHVPDPKAESTLSVLQLQDGALEVVGQIDGIAPTEDIRSVRFDGERGYLVSFKKTDPLFVLDLANPAAPRVVGELKIPGFSTYMHQLDAGHLLALGYEADDKGDFAYFNGIQLQIFDVTNPTQPSLLHKKVFGTRGSSSSALTDHLGFTFLRDRGLLTLPMSICDGGGNGQYGKLSFSGVVALQVSVSGGLVELGRLEEPYPATSQSSGFYYGGACQDWWTDSNSVVVRTVVLDDFLYAVSANRVRVQSLNQLGKDVQTVDFVPVDGS